MPELPEVETIVRQLRPRLARRKIIALNLLDPKLKNQPRDSVAGRTILDVRRLGKQIVLELSALPGGGEGLWLAFHLRMSGRLIWDDCRDGQKEKHLRAWLDLDKGGLFFYDLRRFGLLRVCRSLEEARPEGLEPLSAEFTRARLAGLLRGCRTAIKPWLLRQDRLVGLGNIYASEILFAAGIEPRQPAASIKGARLERLHRDVRRILSLAIEHCGTTFSDFQDSHGRTGSFQTLLSVYGREGEPCPRCGKPVQRIVQQQRSTFFCGGCQR